MIKSKKQSLIVIGVFTLVMLLGTVTYAFFNYTRTGSSNVIKTGRISFNTTQDGNLQLTNIFPLKSTEVNADNLDSVTVGIVGDTTYSGGEEFEITIVDVNNTINGKKIPINYIATYEAVSEKTIGEESDTYWESRNGKDADIYTLAETGSVEEGKQVLVGYIKNSANGIEGTLTIKAYIDGDRIAITDTPDENSEWQQGRTVFTTTEWNSFQNSGTSISFKIKAESNEGIWVNEIRTVNTMNTFPTVITDQSANIKEVYFNKMGATRMQNAYNAATIKADLTYNNEGKVLAWLETNEDDNTKYNLIVASDGETYLTTGEELFLGWLNTEKIMFNNVNTNNVTDMDAMFNGCSSLVSINLSGQGGNNLTSMNGIFIGCDAMQEINMSRFNFGSATINFQGANNVETIILSDANTSRVTNMSNMFSGMSNLESVDLSGIDTSNVTNLNGMFQMCSKLTQLDLSSFETSSINNSGGAYNMFYGCSSLNKIYVSDSWDLSNQPSGMPIFGSNTNLIGNAPNTTYTFDSSKIDKTMAVIATDSIPGYLTDISLKP